MIFGSPVDCKELIWQILALQIWACLLNPVNDVSIDEMVRDRVKIRISKEVASALHSLLSCRYIQWRSLARLPCSLAGRW
jgi:hypothetical protein